MLDFLMVQDNQKRRGLLESEMKKHWPRTLAYLEKYEPTLSVRAAFKRYFRSSDAFYSMFNVAEYTFSRFQACLAEQGDFAVRSLVCLEISLSCRIIRS